MLNKPFHEEIDRAKNLAGHTKQLRGPNVARGPRVGQPWVRPSSQHFKPFVRQVEIDLVLTMMNSEDVLNRRFMNHYQLL